MTSDHYHVCPKCKKEWLCEQWCDDPDPYGRSKPRLCPDCYDVKRIGA